MYIPGHMFVIDSVTVENADKFLHIVQIDLQVNHM